MMMTPLLLPLLLVATMGVAVVVQADTTCNVNVLNNYNVTLNLYSFDGWDAACAIPYESAIVDGNGYGTLRVASTAPTLAGLFARFARDPPETHVSQLKRTLTLTPRAAAAHVLFFAQTRRCSATPAPPTSACSS
jgi:hypothetical protein